MDSAQVASKRKWKHIVIDILNNPEDLRPMCSDDLDNILKLRNHPEIRRYMFTQHEISQEEHKRWFEQASRSPGIDLLILENGKECLGFVQFKESNFKGVFDWGFYIAPYAPKGSGRKLGMAALDYAFNKEKLYKVCGQALQWNKPSISYHSYLGFKQEGVFQSQYFDGEVYHDLVCFGLLKDEWIAQRSSVRT